MEPGNNVLHKYDSWRYSSGRKDGFVRQQWSYQKREQKEISKCVTFVKTN